MKIFSFSAGVGHSIPDEWFWLQDKRKCYSLYCFFLFSSYLPLSMVIVRFLSPHESKNTTLTHPHAHTIPHSRTHMHTRYHTHTHTCTHDTTLTHPHAHTKLLHLLGNLLQFEEESISHFSKSYEI